MNYPSMKTLTLIELKKSKIELTSITDIEKMYECIYADTKKAERLFWYWDIRLFISGIHFDDEESLWVLQALLDTIPSHWRSRGRYERCMMYFKKCTFTNRDLSGMNFNSTSFEDIDLSSTILKNTDMRNARLIDVDLHNMDLKDTKLKGAWLWRANLKHADMRGVDLSNVTFTSIDARGANLEGANLKKAGISNAIDTVDILSDLREVNFSYVYFRDTSLWEADMRWVNLSSRNLRFVIPAGVLFGIIAIIGGIFEGILFAGIIFAIAVVTGAFFFQRRFGSTILDSKHVEKADIRWAIWLSEKMKQELRKRWAIGSDRTFGKRKQEEESFSLAKEIYQKHKFIEAEKLFRQALAIRDDIFGNEWLKNIEILDYILDCLHHQNKFPEEEATYRQVFSILSKNKQKIGSDWLQNFANCLRRQGKITEAKSVYKDILKKNIGKRVSVDTPWKKWKDRDFRISKDTLQGFANCLRDEEKYKEAETLYRKIFQLYQDKWWLSKEQHCGCPSLCYHAKKNKEGFSLLLYHFAQCLHRQEKYEEAETIYQTCLEIMADTPWKTHPQYTSVVKLLSECLCKLGKEEQAHQLEMSLIG